MNVRIYRAATAAGLAVTMSATAYWAFHSRLLDTPRIRVVSIGHGRPPALDDLGTTAQDPSGGAVAPVRKGAVGAGAFPRGATDPGSAGAQNGEGTSSERRTVTGAQVLEILRRQATVSPTEQVGLERVFKIASEVQQGIDAEPSADLRARYQRRLIDSVELRLKLILKDDRVALAQAQLQGLPRLDTGT